MEENLIIEGCNIDKFYEGMKNIDPNLLKKQTFQQGEIFVFMKSVTINSELINKAIESLFCHRSHCSNNSMGPQEVCIKKLIVDSNQILTLGYRDLQNVNSITVTIDSNVILELNNGATGIIFNENIFINNGELEVSNSNWCLESKHTAKFINNGKIEFINSQLFGTGLIINNSEFIIGTYSKLYLGRLKLKQKNEDKENQLVLINDDDDETCLYDFGQNSTKFINAGSLVISGYSLFDLEGYFINGKGDSFEGLYKSESKKSKSFTCSTIFIKSNSKFLFTLGISCTDTFVNDTNGLIICEANTFARFKLSKDICEENLSKKIISNKGTIIANGEVYFVSVNFENFCTIKNTIHDIDCYIKNGVKFGNNFNYSKLIFVNNKCDFVPEFKNTGNRSIVEIGATSSLHIFGYSVINQGTIAIGISRDFIGECGKDKNNNLSLELFLDDSEEIDINNKVNKELLNIIEEVKINGEFLYGFTEPNNCINTTFKNWGNLYCFYKSRIIIGYNSSSVINGKRQVILFNYGLLRNWGYLKICRFSEIINLPSFPFNTDCKLYGIINGSNNCLKPGFGSYAKCKPCNDDEENSLTLANGNCNLNAIIIATRPIPSITPNVYTGGFIKSENKIFSNCSIVKNLCSGVIITWFGFEEDEVQQSCSIVYGIDDKNLKETNVGKLVPIAYPKDLEKWPKVCLSKFLEDQSFSFNFDFKIS